MDKIRMICLNEMSCDFDHWRIIATISKGGHLMTTKFDSVEDAKAFVASIAGADPETFTEVPSLRVDSMSALLLNDPDASEELKKEIRDQMEAQKGFQFTNVNGIEVKIVIGPFRDGFDCWVFGDNGGAMRL
jgi:hypothetical protein